MKEKRQFWVILSLLIAFASLTLFIVERSNINIERREVVVENEIEHAEEDEQPDEEIRRIGGVVTNVIDGDTIDVLLESGKRERVRLIGVDTPEIHWETMTADCYGFEAKEFLTGLIKGKEVWLELDPQQPERDKYDRLLAYVILFDESAEENVNQVLVEQGFGYEFTVGHSYSLRDVFVEAESEAQSSGLGLWSTCVGG